MINFYIPQFVSVIISLIILYVVLRKILFHPVTNFMENRTKSIQDSINSAENAKTEAFALKESYSQQIRKAKAEATKIITEAKNKANREADAILASAKQDATKAMTSALEDIERERTNMIGELKSQVAVLAIAAATKVIQANMNTESNKKLVSKFIDEVGVS